MLTVASHESTGIDSGVALDRLAEGVQHSGDLVDL